jgi:hypothetical protein
VIALLASIAKLEGEKIREGPFGRAREPIVPSSLFFLCQQDPSKTVDERVCD